MVPARPSTQAARACPGSYLSRRSSTLRASVHCSFTRSVSDDAQAAARTFSAKPVNEMGDGSARRRAPVRAGSGRDVLPVVPLEHDGAAAVPGAEVDLVAGLAVAGSVVLAEERLGRGATPWEMPSAPLPIGSTRTPASTSLPAMSTPCCSLSTMSVCVITGSRHWAGGAGGSRSSSPSPPARRRARRCRSRG